MRAHVASTAVGFSPTAITPSDFGLRSEPPTHPDLLDYLASDFIGHGWSLKRLHREIVLSAVYRQASFDTADGLKGDPQNVWLWKMNRRRLDFEATRDALLAVAGRLDSKLGGQPFKSITDPAGSRRTIYAFVDRLNLPGLFRTFDFPNPDATCPQRDATTVPQQALYLMNSPLVIQAARHFLARPEVAGETDPETKVTRMIRLAFGREPAAEEMEWSRDLLKDAGARSALWDEFAQGLLLANEFVFVD